MKLLNNIGLIAMLIFAMSACAKIIIGADDNAYSADNFYIDGNAQTPTIYDQTPEIIASFDGVAADITPDVTTNGVCEFALDGKNFIAYSISQYNKTPGCQFNICELGEGMSITTMRYPSTRAPAVSRRQI